MMAAGMGLALPAGMLKTIGQSIPMLAILLLSACALEPDDVAAVEQASGSCYDSCDAAFVRDRARCYAEPAPTSSCVMQEYQERWACYGGCEQQRDPYSN
jgi:hypothetical protein